MRLSRGAFGVLAPIDRAGAALPLVCLALVLAGEAAGAERLDAAPAAPARVRVNGVTLSLRSLRVEGAAGPLADALAEDWGRPFRLPGSAAPLGEQARWVFGRQRGPFHETLTLRPAGGTHEASVLIAVQDLRLRPGPLPAPPLDLPASFQLVNAVEWPDDPDAVATFTLESSLPPALAATQIRRIAERSGWRTLAAPLPSVAPARGGAWWGERRQREIAVVALPAGRGSRVTLQSGRALEVTP
jgi:hypothetical protein